MTTFKEFVKLLNIRDDILAGADPNWEEQLRKVPEEQFKMMFWVAADVFKMLKQEAVRRNIWEDMIKKRDK
jgi:hypothetical protein